MKLGLHFKSILGITILVVIVAAVLSTISLNATEKNIHRELGRRGLTLASNLAYNSEYAVLTNNIGDLEKFVTGIMQQPDVAYCVIKDPNGNIIYSNGTYEAIEDLLTLTASDKRSIREHKSKIRPFNLSKKQGFIDTAAPILSKASTASLDDEDADLLFEEAAESELDYSKRPESLIGIVHLGLTLANTREIIRENQNLVIRITLSIILGTWLMTIFFTRIALAPINSLMDATQKISSGNLDFDLDIRSRDEFADLAHAFTQMTKELRQSRSELQEYSEQLENKVAKRTQQIRENEKKLRQMLDKSQKMHETLKSTQNQLVQSEKLASLGQLAAGVAHEINNPTGFVMANIEIFQEYVDKLLTIISHLVELVKSNLPEDKEKAELLQQQLNGITDNTDFIYLKKDLPEIIKESLDGAHRIKNIVSNLKNFARPGKEGLNPVNINEEIEKAITLVSNEIKYKCEIVMDCQSVPMIDANPQQLDQVFINILINASHAIEESGTITIKTYAKDDNVYVEIIDDGRGIPDDAIGKIFDPFYTTKEVGKGTGLGLSIVYRIVQEHNGEIDVKSQEGKGTTFTLKFPSVEKTETVQNV